MEENAAAARRLASRTTTLTDTELKVLATLEDLAGELGHAPSFAQMLERMGWSAKSKGSLHVYLERLRTRGVIDGSGRSLRVVR